MFSAAAATATATAVVCGVAAVVISAVAEKREQDHGDNDHPKGAVVKKMAKTIHKKPPLF